MKRLEVFLENEGYRRKHYRSHKYLGAVIKVVVKAAIVMLIATVFAWYVTRAL